MLRITWVDRPATRYYRCANAPRLPNPSSRKMARRCIAKSSDSIGLRLTQKSQKKSQSHKGQATKAMHHPLTLGRGFDTSGLTILKGGRLADSSDACFRALFAKNCDFKVAARQQGVSAERRILPILPKFASLGGCPLFMRLFTP